MEMNREERIQYIETEYNLSDKSDQRRIEDYISYLRSIRDKQSA